jgi:CheY-like chemotaxis protein
LRRDLAAARLFNRVDKKLIKVYNYRIGGEMKILVVDDKDDYFIAEALKKHFPEAQIDSAQESDGAVKMVRENEYTFITMDGNLGIMSSENGPGTAAQIRKFNQTVPIIMLSGEDSYNGAGLSQGATAAQNKDFLLYEKGDFKGFLARIGINT